MQQGRQRTQRKAFDPAIAALDEALRMVPGDAEALGERGHAKLLKGDLAGARVDLEAALRSAMHSRLISAVAHNLAKLEEREGNAARAKVLRASSEQGVPPGCPVLRDPLFAQKATLHHSAAEAYRDLVRWCPACPRHPVRTVAADADLKDAMGFTGEGPWLVEKVATDGPDRGSSHLFLMGILKNGRWATRLQVAFKNPSSLHGRTLGPSSLIVRRLPLPHVQGQYLWVDPEGTLHQNRLQVFLPDSLDGIAHLVEVGARDCGLRAASCPAVRSWTPTITFQVERDGVRLLGGACRGVLVHF